VDKVVILERSEGSLRRAGLRRLNLPRPTLDAAPLLSKGAGFDFALIYWVSSEFFGRVADL
jgi:hypothetical protein